MLALCLKGSYINFGVFWLYEDKAIDKVFGTAVQLMRSIPLQDLMVRGRERGKKKIEITRATYSILVCLVQSFPKLTCAFFHFLDEFAREQLFALPSLRLEDFLYIVEVCELGVDSLDNAVRSYACSALDRLLTRVAKEREKAKLGREAVSATARRWSSAASNHWVHLYLEQNPQVLPSILTVLFSLVLFDDSAKIFALSRPLYASMVLQKEVSGFFYLFVCWCVLRTDCIGLYLFFVFVCNG